MCSWVCECVYMCMCVSVYACSWLLILYVLATSKVISGWVTTWLSDRLVELYILETSKVISEPSYPNYTKCLAGSDKYQCLSHSFNSTRVQTSEVRIPRSPKTGGGRSTHSAIPSGRRKWAHLEWCQVDPNVQFLYACDWTHKERSSTRANCVCAWVWVCVRACMWYAAFTSLG